MHPSWGVTWAWCQVIQIKSGIVPLDWLKQSTPAFSPKLYGVQSHTLMIQTFTGKVQKLFEVYYSQKPIKLQFQKRTSSLTLSKQKGTNYLHNIVKDNFFLTLINPWLLKLQVWEETTLILSFQFAWKYYFRMNSCILKINGETD